MLSKTFWLVNYGVEIGTFYVLYLAQKHFGLSRLFISAGYFEIWHVKCPKKVDRMKGGIYFAGFCDEYFCTFGNVLGRKYEVENFGL